VRAQKLDPAEVSGGFSCVTNTIPSQPGVVLSGITMQRAETREPNIVVLYLQGMFTYCDIDQIICSCYIGNAGNPLGRIPVFAALLKAWSSRPIGHTISAHPHSVPDGTRSTLAHPQISVVAFAPRSYWSSTRRTPTQAGLLADYRIALDYTLATYPRARIVLYGHSLGGAIATCLLSTLPDRMSEEKTSPSLAASSSEVDMISIPSDSEYARVAGVILENPFASIPGMVQALYRSRWTPYRYLAPLVWDKWDASDAMRRASVPGGNGSVLARLRPRVRVMVSEYDEVVPRTMGEGLAELAGVVGAVAEGIGGYDIDGKTSIGGLTVLRGAMHEDGWQKRQWTMQMKEYLDEVARREDNCTPSTSLTFVLHSAVWTKPLCYRLRS
jgi:pimeloyl-ACP methyl ester carboxylesterase